MKMKMKNIFKSKIKNFILNSTRANLKRKMKFIKIRTKTTKKLKRKMKFIKIRTKTTKKMIIVHRRGLNNEK